jgi:hypothetical protein
LRFSGSSIDEHTLKASRSKAISSGITGGVRLRRLDAILAVYLNCAIREEAMRAFIEHRGRYGFLGFKPRFTLYLQIEFSNEERAIVGMRALQIYIFDLSPGFLIGK